MLFRMPCFKDDIECRSSCCIKVHMPKLEFKRLASGKLKVDAARNLQSFVMLPRAVERAGKTHHRRCACHFAALGCHADSFAHAGRHPKIVRIDNQLLRHLTNSARINSSTSCKSLATCTHNAWISSFGATRSGTIIVIIPAAAADRTPLCESSIATHSRGSTASRS